MLRWWIIGAVLVGLLVALSFFGWGAEYDGISTVTPVVVATVTAAASPAPTSTATPREVCGDGWSEFGQRKEGRQYYDSEGVWLAGSVTICHESGLVEIEKN